MRFCTSRMHQELNLAADSKVQQSAEPARCLDICWKDLFFPPESHASL